MLDTIRVKYPICPDPEQLQYWIRKTTTTEKNGVRETFIYNPKITEDEIMIKYTFYPLGYDLNPLLTVELSLPKLIYGNNHQMLGSIDSTIKLANMNLNLVPHAPLLDLSEGILIRLDLCYNHQVGDAVNDYIRALSNLDYPHRRTKYHRYEGVEYRAKHITTKFYNKQRESGSQDAYGILRQETSLLEPKDIQKFLGKRKPTLIDINYDLVSDYLQNDLRKLNLLDNSIATRDTALEKLTQANGNMAGIFYYGLLLSKLDKSKKQIIQQTNIHPRSLDRKLRNIVDDGIPLTLTDREEPLPSLTIKTNTPTLSPHT
jgi:hypothetical protein